MLILQPDQSPCVQKDQRVQVSKQVWQQIGEKASSISVKLVISEDTFGIDYWFGF